MLARPVRLSVKSATLDGYSSVSTTTDLAGNVTASPSAVIAAPVNGWGCTVVGAANVLIALIADAVSTRPATVLVAKPTSLHVIGNG